MGKDLRSKCISSMGLLVYLRVEGKEHCVIFPLEKPEQIGISFGTSKFGGNDVFLEIYLSTSGEGCAKQQCAILKGMLLTVCAVTVVYNSKIELPDHLDKKHKASFLFLVRTMLLSSPVTLYLASRNCPKDNNHAVKLGI